MKRAPCGDNRRFCTWRGACPVFTGGCIQKMFLVCRERWFLAALIARHFLGKDQDRYLGRDQNRDLAGNSGRSVTYRILLLIFMFIFSGMSAGSF